MAVITYEISAFNSRKAENKELVAMVTSTVVPPTINSNDSNFKGTGICMTTSGHRYRVVIAGAIYDFDADGNCTTETGWKLMMAVADITVPTEGSVIDSSSTTTYTRGDEGYEQSSSQQALGNILIDSLKPRDQFAVQALRGILARIDHPEALSINEMNYYCNAAYQWAANMMKVAADSRERIEDVRTEESGGQVVIQGDDLETNTEKLLNNLIVELASTNATLGSGSTAVKAERVSLPEIKALMEAYVAGADNTTVGLQDLISSINALVTALTDITGTVSIGSSGLGRDSDHPLFTSPGTRDTNVPIGFAYGTCSTAATTKAKVSTIAGYKLTVGSLVAIRFSNDVNVASATLNISSTGAKTIYYRNAAIAAGVIKATDIALFFYDGTYYRLIAIDTAIDTLNASRI